MTQDGGGSGILLGLVQPGFEVAVRNRDVHGVVRRERSEEVISLLNERYPIMEGGRFFVDTIETMFRRVDSMAVVGCSRDPSKDAHRVPAFIQRRGYRIVPVNPHAGRVLGETAHPDLTAATARGVDFQLVDVFRPSEDVPSIARQAVETGADYLWLQLGIHHETATKEAREQGMIVIQDRCLKVEYRQRFGDQDRSGWTG